MSSREEIFEKLRSGELDFYRDQIAPVQPESQKFAVFVGDTTPEEHQGDAEDLLAKIQRAIKVPSSRLPVPEEIQTEKDLENFTELKRMLEENQPKWLVALGAKTAKLLLGKDIRMVQGHGQFEEIEIFNHKVVVIPTFHPEYLKINPDLKKLVWSDLKELHQ